MWKMQFPPLAGNPAPEGMETLMPEVIKQNVPHRIDLAFWNHWKQNNQCSFINVFLWILITQESSIEESQIVTESTDFSEIYIGTPM